MDLTVSVVIPAYNEEKHIGKCLSSLMKQVEKPDEIIVVDNASKDRTVEIVKTFPVTLLHEEKRGITPARNKGFNYAKSDIIARTDADTRVPEDWIKRIKVIFKSKKVVGISGPAHFHDFPFPNVIQYNQWQNRAVFAFIKSQLKHDTLYGPNYAIRKWAWDMVKEELCKNDKDVHEDTDLAIHLKNYGTIWIDPTLIMQTSFRNWKKPYNYYEYPFRLLKTFRSHKNRKNSRSIVKIF